MMWLRGDFGCSVEMKFNHSNPCEGSYGCRSKAHQDNAAQDFCTITIVASDNTCKSSSVSSAALLGIVWALLTGGILLSCFFLLFTVRFRRNRIVKMSSPNLNVVTLLGSSLTYGSAYLFGIEKQNPLPRPSMETLIQMRICLLCIGGSLAFGPILGKSWRLYKVFTQRVPDKRVNIKDLQLLLMVGVLVGADIVLLSAWTFLDPIQCLQSLNADLKVTEKGLTCIVYQGYFCTSLYSDLWLFLFLGFKGVLLMYGAYLAGLTYDVSSPPVNQSLTLIVGITVIFLSAKITLVVNRFFHSWHNLVFGTVSGGIFISTTTMNCLIFTPQVRQWKAFENQNESISHVAKFFTSSSKNFHSTVYSEEEIGQLIGEKNTMMHLLAEKDTAIAILQEQINSAKEKLTRLVAAEGNQEAIDSRCPQDHSAADCSSVAAKDTPGDLSLPGQERNMWQILKFSNSSCIQGSSNKKDCVDDLVYCVDDLEYASQPNIPLETTNKCRLLSSTKNISDCSRGPDDHHKWLFRYTTPHSPGALKEPPRKNFSSLRIEAEQAQVQQQLLGISSVSSDKLQEALQELNVDHKASSQTSTGEAEQSAACERRTGGWPQEAQATTLTRLSPYKAGAERKIPTCLPGYTVPGAWCIMNKPNRMQRSHSKESYFPWATAGDATERRPLPQPLSFPSSVFKSRLHYKAENWSEHPSKEETNRLLDKRPMENCAPLLCPDSPMTFHRQPQDLASCTAHLYLDSDSSSTISSGDARCCRHRHCCEFCHRHLSSSSDSCSTDSEPGLSLHYGTNLFSKPQPTVNFNEDLEPTYV